MLLIIRVDVDFKPFKNMGLYDKIFVNLEMLLVSDKEKYYSKMQNSKQMIWVGEGKITESQMMDS